MRNSGKLVAAIVLLSLVAAIPVFACTTLIVGKDVSSTGYVLVAHTEDDGGRCKVEHGWVDAAKWPKGSTLPAEEGRAAIPQVSQTYGFYWSQVKAASGGFSNADAFLNENGVWIVSNSNASSREDTKDPARVTDGGIEYNLRRVVAERATSARHAMEIIVEMVEKWGYAPSGRAYTVADKDEAWMIQIVSGKHYVATRCPDDQVVVMPNHYTIHDVFDMPWTEVIVPDDIAEYAISKGWISADEPFDFAKAYQAPGSYKAAGNTYRQKFGMSRIQNKLWTEDEYPFCVAPAGKLSPQDLMSVISDHYEGQYVAEDYLLAYSPGQSPHSTTLRRICTETTVEATVCEFTEELLTTTLWTTFGRSCELPFIPLHPLTKNLPKEIDTMKNSAKQLAEHLLPDAQMQTWKDTGWQEFRDFENKFEMVYSDNHAKFEKVKLNYEYRMNQKSQAVVKEAKELINSGKQKAAVKLLSDFDQKATTEALTLIENFSAGFKTATVPSVQISRSNPGDKVTVVFTIDYPQGFVIIQGTSTVNTPIENSLIFGMGFLNTRTAYVPAIEGSLKRINQRTWSVDFDAAELAKRAPCEGVFEHFIGGILTTGESFVGQCQVEFVK